MFSNYLTEMMWTIMEGMFLRHGSRGGGAATEYGSGEALGLWQTLLHVFLQNHGHLGANGIPRPSTSLFWQRWIKLCSIRKNVRNYQK